MTRQLRVRVLIGVAVLLAVVLIWRIATRRETDLEGLSPDAARIEKYRRRGNVEALAGMVSNPKADVATLAVRALGSLGAKAMPHIEAAMQDDRPEIRAQATLAMARAAGLDSADALAQVLAGDPSENVRAAAATALGQMYAYTHMDALLAALDDPSRLVRHRVSDAVQRITGVDFGFQPDASPQQRRRAASNMRALWPQMQKTVQDRYAPGRS